MTIKIYLVSFLRFFKKAFIMTKYLLPVILVMVVLVYSCKKDATSPTTPVPTGNNDSTAHIDSVDNLLGIYIGNVRTTTDIFYGTGHQPEHSYDTTYRTDTIEIKKISADSFAIDSPGWIVYGKNGHFKYNASNQYNTGNGGSGSSSGEILYFFPASDSLYVKKDFGHYSGYGPYSKTTDEFFGKR